MKEIIKHPLAEFLTTEKSYTQSLEQFKKILLSKMGELEQTDGLTEKMIPYFTNLLKIVSSFLAPVTDIGSAEDLEKILNKTATPVEMEKFIRALGKSFSKGEFKEKMSSYLAYVKNYTHYTHFLEVIFKQAGVFSVSALYIMPVQRIPRYILLFKAAMEYAGDLQATMLQLIAEVDRIAIRCNQAQGAFDPNPVLSLLNEFVTEEGKYTTGLQTLESILRDRFETFRQKRVAEKKTEKTTLEDDLVNMINEIKTINQVITFGSGENMDKIRNRKMDKSEAISFARKLLSSFNSGDHLLKMKNFVEFAKNYNKYNEILQNLFPGKELEKELANAVNLLKMFIQQVEIYSLVIKKIDVQGIDGTGESAQACRAVILHAKLVSDKTQKNAKILPPPLPVIMSQRPAKPTVNDSDISPVTPSKKGQLPPPPPSRYLQRGMSSLSITSQPITELKEEGADLSDLLLTFPGNPADRVSETGSEGSDGSDDRSISPSPSAGDLSELSPESVTPLSTEAEQAPLTTTGFDLKEQPKEQSKASLVKDSPFRKMSFIANLPTNPPPPITRTTSVSDRIAALSQTVTLRPLPVTGKVDAERRESILAPTRIPVLPPLPSGGTTTLRSQSMLKTQPVTTPTPGMQNQIS